MGIGQSTTMQSTILLPTMSAMRGVLLRFRRSSRVSSVSARRTCLSVASSPSPTPVRRTSQWKVVGWMNESRVIAAFVFSGKRSRSARSRVLAYQAWRVRV